VTLFVFMQKCADWTLEKASAFSQVLRTEPQMIAISAQNRSSDPLRLHQNKKGHPCGDPFCFMQKCVDQTLEKR